MVNAKIKIKIIEVDCYKSLNSRGKKTSWIGINVVHCKRRQFQMAALSPGQLTHNSHRQISNQAFYFQSRTFSAHQTKIPDPPCQSSICKEINQNSNQIHS